MTKAILQFNLPEDEADFKFAKDGFGWYEVSMEMERYLREELKYHYDNYKENQIKILEQVRDKLHEIILEEIGIADIYSYVE